MSDQGFEEGSNKNGGESDKRDRSESRERDNEERRSEGDRADDRHNEESNRDDRDERDRGEGEGERDRKHEGPTTSLLVRNLNFNLRADELKKLFAEFGEIRDVYIPMVKQLSFDSLLF
jgi:RNA recognition motif-containing protein